MLLYRIVDPVRAVYEVFDLSHAVEKLVQTTLRSIIGDMVRLWIVQSKPSGVGRYTRISWGNQQNSVPEDQVFPSTDI